MRSVSSLEDVTVSGVDLGIRNVAATVLRTWNNTGEINESNVLHKSKDYHYNAGKHIYSDTNQAKISCGFLVDGHFSIFLISLSQAFPNVNVNVAKYLAPSMTHTERIDRAQVTNHPTKVPNI